MHQRVVVMRPRCDGMPKGVSWFDHLDNLSSGHDILLNSRWAHKDFYSRCGPRPAVTQSLETLHHRRSTATSTSPVSPMPHQSLSPLLSLRYHLLPSLLHSSFTVITSSLSSSCCTRLSLNAMVSTLLSFCSSTFRAVFIRVVSTHTLLSTSVLSELWSDILF